MFVLYHTESAFLCKTLNLTSDEDLFIKMSTANFWVFNLWDLRKSHARKNDSKDIKKLFYFPVKDNISLEMELKIFGNIKNSFTFFSEQFHFQLHKCFKSTVKIWVFWNSRKISNIPEKLLWVTERTVTGRLSEKKLQCAILFANSLFNS